MYDKKIVDSFLKATGCNFREFCAFLDDRKFLDATKSVQGAAFLKLRMAGYSWNTIAEGRGLNPQTARYTAQRALNYIKEQHELQEKLKSVGVGAEPTPEESEEKRKYREYVRFLMHLCEFKEPATASAVN